VFHGEPDDANRTFPELKLREAAVLVPIIGVIVFTGIYPKPMLERIEPSVNALIEHVEVKAGITTAEPDVIDVEELEPAADEPAEEGDH
jgi:NADH-quinone oxidoreductase subunit M